MKDPADLQKLREEFKRNISRADDANSIEGVRIHYLGRKGVVSALMDNLKEYPPEERPRLGKSLNDLKKEFHSILANRINELDSEEVDSKEEIDLSLPGRISYIGRRHPLTSVWEELLEIFTLIGFEVVRGPEVETDYYNFTALNFPKNHPARDMQDTFYLTKDTMLRTHTSPVQIRTMLSKPPPIRVIAPGRVYRNEAVSARSYCVFHQVEGLYVDENVSLADLKGTLISFAKQFFGENVRTRFRPSYFPFTEPSAEMDVSCVVCGGKGCRICKQTGWVELLGAGMVHPTVFENVKYDPDKVSGFAWGMGIERVAMMKYGIDDIRLFYEGDMRFIEGF